RIENARFKPGMLSPPSRVCPAPPLRKIDSINHSSRPCDWMSPYFGMDSIRFTVTMPYVAGQSQAKPAQTRNLKIRNPNQSLQTLSLIASIVRRLLFGDLVLVSNFEFRYSSFPAERS